MTTVVAEQHDLDARRARVRAEAVLASRVVPVARPLDEFVAVNPLAGFEDQAFGDAVHAAQELYGIRGYLPETSYRALYHQGRIVEADLRWAIRTRPPLEPDGSAPHPDRQTVGAESALVDELLTATIPEPASRSVRTAAEHHDAVMGTDLALEVDQHAIRWCAAYLGTEAEWRLPGREAGLYGAWRDLVVLDPTLDPDARRLLSGLPERSDDAVLDALERLGVDPGQHRFVFRAELSALPGWAAHIRWRAEQHHDIDLLDYLAMRLSYTTVLVDRISDTAAGRAWSATGLEGSASFGMSESPWLDDPGRFGSAPTGGGDAGEGTLDARHRLDIWQAALERGFRSQLLDSVGGRRSFEERAVEPDAQIVCCIDVRSEGLRRAIEGQGRYETLGFAGFFGVAITWEPMSGGGAVASCPALVSPRHTVAESATGSVREMQRYRRGLDGESGALDGLHDAKSTPGAAFVLAEAVGWITGPAAALRTVAPRRWSRATRWVHRRAVAEPASGVELDGIPLNDRILTARTALTTMGLGSFAPLVVLCGHTSSTAANPYEAALRCGACGGHTGGPNARVLAAILNDAEVREAIRHGVGAIEIPAGTLFLAAEHDTTSDTVRILDPGSIPPTHRGQVDRLRGDLDAAGEQHAAERCADLPGAPEPRHRRHARRHVARRANDWAETFPEWGLAGNAAFVVGPRSMTSGLDLQRRVFLHSYDAALDQDGLALETILTAPLVVAQWINCQYYFSSTDPDVFGSGTKTVHNAIGTVGVLAGRTGDLQLGLPRQSIAVGDQLVHEPLRLLAVVQAPLERVASIIDRNPSLRDLVAGEWITVVARADPDDEWATWTVQGWADHDEGARR